jgi:hypothetical protein
MGILNSDLNDHKGHRSSMRYNNRFITYICGVLMLSLAAYIVISAIKGIPIDGGSWGGMGGFLTGIGIIIGGAYYNQKEQKKTELINFNDNINT